MRAAEALIRARRADLAAAQALMRAAVPEADLAFIRGFEDQIRIGDYLFVHAGVRPDRPLAAQEPRDLERLKALVRDARRAGSRRTEVPGILTENDMAKGDKDKDKDKEEEKEMMRR